MAVRTSSKITVVPSLLRDTNSLRSWPLETHMRKRCSRLSSNMHYLMTWQEPIRIEENGQNNIEPNLTGRIAWIWGKYYSQSLSSDVFLMTKWEGMSGLDTTGRDIHEPWFARYRDDICSNSDVITNPTSIKKRVYLDIKTFLDEEVRSAQGWE